MENTMQTKKANRKRCAQCGLLVKMAQLRDGKPVLDFHTNEVGEGCPSITAESKADRDLRRAFTENKHGELA